MYLEPGVCAPPSLFLLPDDPGVGGADARVQLADDLVHLLGESLRDLTLDRREHVGTVQVQKIAPAHAASHQDLHVKTSYDFRPVDQSTEKMQAQDNFMSSS